MSARTAELTGALLHSSAAKDVRTNVLLSELGRWKVGGAADIVVSPSSRAGLVDAVRLVAASGLPRAIVGDGTNLLFDDEGFRGAIIHIGRPFAYLHKESDGYVRAGGGIWVPRLVRSLVNSGLAGLEHAIGIPGTIAGLCVMNGGSQRKSIGECLVRLEVADWEGKIFSIDRKDLELRYRSSKLQEVDLVVLEVHLALGHGDIADLRRRALETLVTRRRKFPANRANCGSVFVSDPALYDLIGPPGQAIERAGLKGLRSGGARISPEHANFIVNEENASSADILCLIALARARVRDISGITMRTEVRYLHPYRGLMSADAVLPRLAARDA